MHHAQAKVRSTEQEDPKGGADVPRPGAPERCYVGVWGLGPQVGMHHAQAKVRSTEQEDPKWCPRLEMALRFQGASTMRLNWNFLWLTSAIVLLTVRRLVPRSVDMVPAELRGHGGVTAHGALGG
jgi:hypothetical protein